MSTTPEDNEDYSARLLTAWQPLLERMNAGCSAPPAYEHLAAATSAVNEVAKALVKKPELRVQIGSTPGIWPSLRNAFIFSRNHLFCVYGVGKQGVACPTRAERAVDLAAAHFQLVRNLCAQVQSNQKDAWEQGLYEPAEEIMSYLCSWLTSTKDCCTMMKDKVSKCVNMGTQMLANMMTGNPEVQDKMWPRYFQEDADIFKQLLSTCDIHRVMFVLICIHNCIHKCPERCKYMTQTPLGRDILKCLLAKAQKMLQEECSAFDFIYAIFSNMIELDLTPNIMDAICDGMDPHRTRILSQYHVTFLQLLDGMLDAQANRSDDRPPIEIGIDTAIFFVAVTKKLVHSISRNAKQVKDNMQATDVFGLDVDGLVLILQFFARVTPELGPDAKMKLVKAGLADTLLTLLNLASKLYPRSTLSKRSSSDATPASSVPPQGFFMIKSDTVKVLANLCYEAKEVQDEIRRIGGIPVILNECRVDDNNPYIKEHAILAIRNLCDGNTENQDLVASLTPQGIAPESEQMLDEAGIQAKVDDSGRVRVGKKAEVEEILAMKGLSVSEVQL
ncbi:uncharacterized protein SPPG_06855 [Spizellomyces punctatus DAOM BR117]|uniref:Ataxin-10 homolog n=1 Tax=Spizellomyces punctatus (strain DAOM BR117) TaxID=645134 RepID=A0A0L0HAC6_SPIPD|nr:uncharacterized protein SPPG_06855 [Spizellomyces punctatus DAOM BR117]KNC97859.1 hypothetical protein SPPG_06855 [Spizellomyces punctatus DAOM BR117]|eukprot:XP_016605899.1 hypothetical protein SPPG_06855 [Spizellomyces punctatus DAOM BR117]